MYPSNKILLTKTLKTHIRVYTYHRTPQNLQTHNPKLFSENNPIQFRQWFFPELCYCFALACAAVWWLWCVLWSSKKQKKSPFFVCIENLHLTCVVLPYQTCD
jgi:hypothetical protein